MRRNCKISRAELKKLYLDKKISIKQISNKLGCSYWNVWKSMKALGIKARSLSEANTLNNLKRKIIIPRNKLKELYLTKRLSTLSIARLYNCHHSVILNRLKENNIKRRDVIEANTKYPKKDFDGTQEDKAYMLGFALGDLHVRKPNKNGKTIVIQGNSTKLEQINLIKNLFEDYGPVQITDIRSGFTNGKRINLHLNESFNFLLYKKDAIPNWILSSETAFFAFVAGYVDAEGHIRTKIPTWLTISSYDKKILSQIHENFKRFGLDGSRLRISAKKGYSSLAKPIPYKKDVWQLGIYSKKELLKSFNKLLPYLKHKNKVDSIHKSIKQIKYRNEKYGYRKNAMKVLLCTQKKF